MYRLGVVSFLNSRPLIAGLRDNQQAALLFDVPARLPAWLDEGRVDAALIPIIDILRDPGRLTPISDACIGCDGETMTVRVFSQVPPDRIKTLWVDGDSHTSVALADVLWRELYDRELELRRVDARSKPLHELESVLLIGDKVVDPARSGFAYEVDLGGAWRQHTGLPFVFAVWATLNDEKVAGTNTGGLSSLLSDARDLGVQKASEIAAADGPQLGWPVELAERYLTRCLRFKLDIRAVEGANLFGRLCAKYGVIPSDTNIAWPADLACAAAAKH